MLICEFMVTLYYLGFKVKETSKVGPRPEKPIEIYEFERYFIFQFNLFDFGFSSH